MKTQWYRCFKAAPVVPFACPAKEAAASTRKNVLQAGTVREPVFSGKRRAEYAEFSAVPAGAGNTQAASTGGSFPRISIVKFPAAVKKIRYPGAADNSAGYRTHISKRCGGKQDRFIRNN